MEDEDTIDVMIEQVCIHGNIADAQIGGYVAKVEKVSAITA
jgi:hypothetical protein